jgi:formylglycine-generating enzyme required for sulfatase activity
LEQQSVFISYRRNLSKHLARSIYLDLRANGWDVFLDVDTINSGDFDRIILDQIGARAHFILIISSGSLEKCVNSSDWVRLEIEEAVRTQRNIVPIIDEGTKFEDEVSYLPSDLRAVISKKNALPLTHFYFDEGMEKLRTRFLKIPEYIKIATPPTAHNEEDLRRMAVMESKTQPKLSSLSLLPAPFEWIEIPGKGYSIAKYPITNGQFARFIEAGGYKNDRWWTNEGWKERVKNNWNQPQLWTLDKWNGVAQPVVGVSWYESVAFCLWLGSLTEELITIPTEDQWQYAAQGDDDRAYPWGEIWDSSRCNNNLDGIGFRDTTPVHLYEGRGDSAFGVVDMAGNVWEWCLTDYNSKTNDINSNGGLHVLRGGSWDYDNPIRFRCDFRYWSAPIHRNQFIGFRISRFA